VSPAPPGPGVRIFVAAIRRDATRWIGLLCLAYLALECAYVLRLPLVMDEFQGAFAVDRLSREVPYRDYRPYKTVLGYALQWPALRGAEALGLELWGRMLAIKLWMAVATAGVLALAARRLARWLDPAAVVLGLAMLVSMSTFLERSAALRVDMLTALFGLGSLLALLDRRVASAGLLAGLSFLVSQKGVYYALAGGAGLALDWAWGGPSRVRMLRCIRFGAAAALPVALYLAAFALVAPAPSIGTGVVANATRIAFEDFYAMGHFWVQTVVRNPGFYAAMAAGLAVLALRGARPGAAGERERVVLGYGVTLVALCAWHKQPWPYFFVLLLPTGFVLASCGLEDALERLADREPRAWRLAALGFVAIALLIPLSRVPRVLARDSEPQRVAVELASGILEPGDHYLGGLEFVFTHRQVPGLSWLDGPRLAALDAQTPEEIARLVERFSTSRPRLVIWNYRIARLPEPLLGPIRATYAPLFGNVFIYSPALAAGATELDLWFAGRYAVSGPSGSGVVVDGRTAAVGDEIHLEAGRHRVSAAAGHRLHLLPDDVESRLARIDPALARPGALFVSPYEH
jgi:hypothetical protein